MCKNAPLKFSYSFCASLLFCLPLPAAAQAVSLYEIVSKTISNYPLLQQRKAEMETGKAHEQTVKGGVIPSLLLQDQFDIGTVNSLPGSYFPFGNTPSVSSGNSDVSKNTSSAGNVGIAFLQWEFLNFGYYGAQQKEAAAQSEIFAANFAADKYLVTQYVVSLYIDWLKKYRLVQIRNDDVARTQVILTAIRANVMSGLKPGVDSSTARAVYSGAKIAWLQAMDEYNNDKIILSEYSGMQLDNEIPDSNIISAALLLRLSVPTITDSISFSHPLLNIYQKQYEAQLAVNNTIAKRYLPRLDINGAYWMRTSGVSPSGVFAGYAAPGVSLAMPYNSYNYLVGLSATFDIADIRHRRDLLTEGQHNADAKAAALKNEATNLYGMLQQINSSCQTTLEKLAEIPVQEHSAQDAYMQQLALYRSGLNTLIDVTNAQYALLQAETNLVVTQTELLKLLYIRAALGGQFDNFLQNFK